MASSRRDLLKNGVAILVGATMGGTALFAWPGAASLPSGLQAILNTAPIVPPRAGVVRIVAFGSSSTLGVGASSPKNTYPALLEAALNSRSGNFAPVEVLNRGIGGQDIRDMRQRLEADVVARRPDLVIWQIGSNDTINRVPMPEFERDLRDGIAAFRRSGAAFMLMEPQLCPEIRPDNAYLGAVRRIAIEERVRLIPRFEWMRNWIQTGLATEAELIGPDHFHMTDRGYALLAQALFGELRTLDLLNRQSAVSELQGQEPQG